MSLNCVSKNHNCIQTPVAYPFSNYSTQQNYKPNCFPQLLHTTIDSALTTGKVNFSVI